LHSIWSFNWDCILENALEQIGLPGVKPRFESPWEKNHYATHVHSDYFPRSSNPKAINIHKPHGCVRALHKAWDAKESNPNEADELSYRLMVGKRELHNRSSCPKAKPEDQLFYAVLKGDVSGRFNLLFGWSMGEKSLRRELFPSFRSHATTFAIADPKLSAGHRAACRFTGCQQQQIYFPLTDCPDRDDVFIWQHALYSLERLEALNRDKPILDMQGANWPRSIIHSCAANFLTAWADEFLPT